MQFPIVIEKDQDGYFARCPTLEGCMTWGGTYEETMKNIKEAIELYVEDCIADDQILIANESITISLIDLPIEKK